MKLVIFFLLYLSVVVGHASVKTELHLFSNDDQCLSTREYITTYKFLKDKKEYGLKEQELQKTADTVSQGCSGSSQRFINVLKTLVKLGVDTRSSIEYAINFIHKSDAYTEVFIEVFKRSYDPVYLNLDALTSLKMSLRLSKDYKGKLENSLSDFKELVDFCLDDDSMKLSVPKCGQIAMNITALGEKFEEPIADAFINAFKFIQEDKEGPQLVKSKALAISQKIITNGPIAVDNFKKFYLFATSKKGLGKTAKDALSQALILAERTLPKK